MPYQPAILGSARLGNFRLGYRPAALTALRQTKARITLAGEPVRVRAGSVTIRDIANDAPNTCSFIVNKETPPVNAQRIRITINSNEPRLLFAGAIEEVHETYDLKPDQIAYHCTAQDDTPRANRRIPLGYWENISATTVVHELVAGFAPGFTTANVQAGLPTITVHFEGSEAGMNGCLRQIAKLIGGYFYWEDRDLHLFTVEATDLPDDLDSTPGRFLDEPHIKAIRDDKQIRTRVYGKGHQESTLSDIAIVDTAIPLGDVSMYNPAGGQVISESQILDYTGTAVGGAGALVGTTLTPTNGPTVTKQTGTGLAAGDYGWAVSFGTAAGKTLPSPIAAATVGGTVPPPAAPPTVARSTGGTLADGVYKWKTAFKDAAGLVTLLSGESSPLTMETLATAPSSIGTAGPTDMGGGGALDAGGAYNYAFTFVNGSLETTISPVAAFTMFGGSGDHAYLFKSGTSSPPSGYSRRFYRTEGGGSVYKRLPGSLDGFLGDGGNHWYEGYADSALGAVAPTASTAHYHQATITLPVSSDPSITVVAIYRTKANGSTFYHVTDVSNGTVSITDTTVDASLTVVAPTVATAIYLSAALSAISIGPAGTTFRDVWRTAVGGAQLKLLTTLANNTTTVYTDTVADGSLGANIHTTDTSGLVAESGEVPAGSTSLLVTATPFTSTGGWVFIGAMPVRYTGISGSSLTGVPASGPGSLTTTVRYGSELIAASMLTGVTGLVRPLIKGAPIHIWVQEDDLDAQAALAARESTDDDPSDGIIEYKITDERRGEASLRALCRADLAQYSRGGVVVPYACRDVKTKSGKPLVINTASPFIDETLTINDVTIDQIDIVPGLAPRFTVTASNVGVVTVEDLLRRMASSLEGA